LSVHRPTTGHHWKPLDTCQSQVILD